MFSKKLADIQEEFNASKSSQDPYKISIHSMRTISKLGADGDTLESKGTTPMKTMRSEEPFKTDKKEEFGRTDDRLPQGYNWYWSTLSNDYKEGLTEAKMR